MSTNHGQRKHYFRARKSEPGRCLCGKTQAEGWHYIIPESWRGTLATIVVVRSCSEFRPIWLTRHTQHSATPLVGGNVVRTLVGAGLVELVSSTGRTAWYRLTPLGVQWMSTPTTKGSS